MIVINFFNNNLQFADLPFQRILYSRLLDNSDDAVKDSLEREIGKLQITIENINYNHFNEIKLLCKADQQQDYSKLIHEIAFLFAPHRSGKPGKP